jgi:hypothetical protein
VLRRGFRLSWDPSAGPCYECEQTNGQCGYDQFGVFLGCLCSDGRVHGPDCGKTKSISSPIFSCKNVFNYLLLSSRFGFYLCFD